MVIILPEKTEENCCVLVTGATGYIGSHAVLELLNAGFKVIALGNSKCREEEKICLLPQCLMRVLILANCKGSMLTFKRCNLQYIDELERIFKTEKFNIVVHLASSKGVAPSIEHPLEYYANNLISSINLLKMCEKYEKKKLIFMSSATVYGVPKEMPVTENSITGVNITNPYGWAKFMVEQILRDICKSSKDWRIITLRAFDPAGAHSSGLLGDDLNSKGPKHLMPLIASVALGKRKAINICGNTFPTHDGSGSRDFVHVCDVALAIVKSVERINFLENKNILKEENIKEEEENKYLINGKINNNNNNNDKNENIEAGIYNLGLGRDHTVLEMVANYEKACRKSINKIIMPPRPGDIASIYCEIEKAKKNLNWIPKYGVEDICIHLNNWYNRCPNGYN
ncbi:Epimerase domain-containing protein [Meloidogyne graminicola]|uniref:UDP-glucose 4-epimerase n=1 Tax=Meloidogyne graminicola TaxID=189291 RepID=A0A8S9ZTG8_9BILA|nr:Epimerase domain-containing protein [Meloidogyne graminicola]